MKIKEIQSIIKDFEESNLMTLELITESMQLKLSKNKSCENVSIEQTPKPVESTIVVESLVNHPTSEIKSPLVGTFYLASSPNHAPFVAVGDHIKKGDVVCIVEAMKIMNEITSPFDGIIEDIKVTNGDAIGFDDILFVVKNHDATT